MTKFLEDCQFLMKLCGYSAHGSADAVRYRWSGVINQVLSFWHIYFVGTCIAFVCDSRQPRDERLMLLLSVVAFAEQAGAHYTFTLQKSKIFAFFEHFGALTSRRAIIASQRVLDFYSEAERKTTAIKDGAKSYLFIPYNSFLFGPFIFTVIQRIIIEKCASDPITWHVLLKASVPFERNSVHGYLYYTLTSAICVYNYVVLLVIYVQFFLGMCFYLDAFCQDFGVSFKKIDKLQEEYVRKKLVGRPLERAEFDYTLNKEICGAVDFQAEIVDYYTRMNDILNGIILINMAGGAIFCAISVQQIQAAAQHIDLDFITRLLTLLASLIVISPYCYAATMAFDCIQSLNGSMFYTKWYELPVKYQRYVKMMLMPSQKLRQLSGYGLIVCSLETLRNVLKMAGSLYVMINSI